MSFSGYAIDGQYRIYTDYHVSIILSCVGVGLGLGLICSPQTGPLCPITFHGDHAADYNLSVTEVVLSNLLPVDRPGDNPLLGLPSAVSKIANYSQINCKSQRLLSLSLWTACQQMRTIG